MQKLKDDDVEWVVNEIAELGVKIGNQFFFMYKGSSLVYDGGGEDIKPMRWRPVSLLSWSCYERREYYSKGQKRRSRKSYLQSVFAYTLKTDLQNSQSFGGRQVTRTQAIIAWTILAVAVLYYNYHKYGPSWFYVPSGREYLKPPLAGHP